MSEKKVEHFHEEKKKEEKWKTTMKRKLVEKSWLGIVDVLFFYCAIEGVLDKSIFD